MNRQFTHIDCFAGPGGICTGLHAAGFNTLVAIEYIKSCCETYSANHPEVHVIHSDIRDVTEDQVLPYIPEDGVDLVTSGMPCETFSTAGNTSRSFYDDRHFCRTICRHRNNDASRSVHPDADLTDYNQYPLFVYVHLDRTESGFQIQWHLPLAARLYDDR